MELTTVTELIEMLKKLPPKSKVFVCGTYGYLNIVEDEDGNVTVVFDDKEEVN